MLHIVDPLSPKETIYLTNPFYRDPLDTSPSFLTPEERRVLGDPGTPTYPMQVSSLAYCGEKLQHIPRPAPELMWECKNFTLPGLLLDAEEPICPGCIAKLDEERARGGYRPIIESLMERRKKNA